MRYTLSKLPHAPFNELQHTETLKLPTAFAEVLVADLGKRSDYASGTFFWWVELKDGITRGDRFVLGTNADGSSFIMVPCPIGDPQAMFQLCASIRAAILERCAPIMVIPA